MPAKSETTESRSSNSHRWPVSFKIAGFNTNSASEPQSSPYHEWKGHSLEKEILFPPGEND